MLRMAVIIWAERKQLGREFSAW